MTSTRIRAIIADAEAREQQTGEFLRAIEERVPVLRAALELPENAPAAALLAFITGYIRSVPACLRLVRAVSRRQGFFDYAEPFLSLAEGYFLEPPQAIPGTGGLEALLDEAFLAHRLLEEVNDNHVRHLQRPLLPVDMTEANIIVHHLLGDAFATCLEEVVQYTAGQLLVREHVWERARELAGAEFPLVCTDRLAGDAPAVRLRLAS